MKDDIDGMAPVFLKLRLRKLQEREAKMRAAIAEATFWLDEGAPGRALEVLRDFPATEPSLNKQFFAGMDPDT